MMWLPRPLYEAVPYIYLGAGAALLGAAFLTARGLSGLLFGLGAASLVVGLVIWMRRRDYRAGQQEYDVHVLDDQTGQFRRLSAAATSSSSSEPSGSSESAISSGSSPEARSGSSPGSSSGEGR